MPKTENQELNKSYVLQAKLAKKYPISRTAQLMFMATLGIGF